MRSMATKLALAIWALLLPSLVLSLVYAHRGVGSAELGLPIWTTVGIAVVCNWVVMLWPAAKKKGSSPSGYVNKNNADNV